MKRFQLYLEEDIYEMLLTESRVKKKRISALIRETLRERYGMREKKVVIIRNVTGLWKDKEKTTREILSGMRNEKK